MLHLHKQDQEPFKSMRLINMKGVSEWEAIEVVVMVGNDDEEEWNIGYNEGGDE